MKVLVVCAHPDDETLIAGGAITRHVAAGDQVICAYVTDGISARHEGGSTPEYRVDDERNRRRLEFLQAVALLGAAGHDAPPQPFLGLDNRLDVLSVLDLAQYWEGLLEQYGPEVVYTHHAHDLNQDHQAVHHAVVIATRPHGGGRGVRAVYAGEMPGYGCILASGARRYVVLSQTELERKLAALETYGSEARDRPHPRAPQSVTALAHIRGVECGREAAEAFAVVWEIWDR